MRVQPIEALKNEQLSEKEDTSTRGVSIVSAGMFFLGLVLLCLSFYKGARDLLLTIGMIPGGILLCVLGLMLILFPWIMGRPDIFGYRAKRFAERYF